MSAVLSIKNLQVNYGPIQALKGVDIEVEKGSIVALLGANGAGKTTTLKTVSGLIRPSAGEILLNGKDIAGKSTYYIAKHGLTQSPEGRHVFIGLTVEENLRAGAYGLRGVTANGEKLSAKARAAKNFDRVYALFPRLKDTDRFTCGVGCFFRKREHGMDRICFYPIPCLASYYRECKILSLIHI